MIQLTNYINQCGYNIPGTNKLYLANWSENIIDSLIFSDSNDFSFIEDIDKSIIWFEFNVEKSVVDWAESQEITPNRRRFTTTLNTIIKGLDSDKRQTINELLRGRLIAIVGDKNGKYWLFGEETGLRSITYTAGTGTNTGENAYRIVFNSIHTETNKEISQSYIDSIQPPVGCFDFCTLINDMDSVIINDLLCLLTDLNEPCV